jgi:hypothetical protein
VPPVVIDAADLIATPEETVRAYCDAVGIPFVPEALAWRPGMHQAWERTSRWHEMASRTTGFVRTEPPGPEAVAANPALAGYLAYHLPHYERLRAAALRIPPSRT